MVQWSRQAAGSMSQGSSRPCWPRRTFAAPLLLARPHLPANLVALLRTGIDCMIVECRLKLPYNMLAPSAHIKTSAVVDCQEHARKALPATCFWGAESQGQGDHACSNMCVDRTCKRCGTHHTVSWAPHHTQSRNQQLSPPSDVRQQGSSPSCNLRGQASSRALNGSSGAIK